MTGTRDLRGADIIDSRDVIVRFDELQDERESAVNSAPEVEPADKWTTEDGTVVADCWDEDQESEFQALRKLAEEASSSPDWGHGETLIRDSYFREYAEQLADDIGAIDRNARWPVNCIDWERAAEELKADYFSVTFGDDEYWIRG